MKNFCYKLICCGCRKQDDVIENLSESETRIYPENERTKYILDKNELIFYGHLKGEEIHNCDIPSDRVVKKIVCGKNHALFLLDTKELGIVGSNENGQLGLSLKTKFCQMIQFNSINFSNEVIRPKSRVIDIAAGDDFSMILLKNEANEKILYHLEVKKEDKFINEEEDKLKVVHRISFDEKIDIASIYGFGKRRVLITNDNSIYIYGIDFSLNIMNVYSKIYSFEKRIKMFSLGNDHSLILDENNKIYCWGNNTFGELGIQNSIFVETPTLIPYFENIKIKKIGCGARHSVVLDFDKNLYTFGDNSDGQSIGHNTNNWIPQLFNEGKSMKIVDFSVGNYHNFLKTRTGDIFCWGNSKDGKFGDKYNVPFNIPRNILKLKGTNVSYIALGETISIFFTTSIDNKILIERKEIKTNICINKNQ